MKIKERIPKGNEPEMNTLTEFYKQLITSSAIASVT